MSKDFRNGFDDVHMNNNLRRNLIELQRSDDMKKIAEERKMDGMKVLEEVRMRTKKNI